MNREPPTTAPSSSAWYFGCAALAVVVYLFVGGLNVRRGAMNNDEGFYAYASREVMQGRVPYRDFAYSQTPVLPYVQGAAMNVVGFGVRQQRWLNVAWTTLSLVVIVAIWKRADLPPLAGIGLILLWCLSRALVYYSTIGKTYALAQLLLILAAATFFWRASIRARFAVLTLACVLAVGCRLTVAPAAIMLWLGFAVMERGRISRAWLVGLPAVISILLIGPFVLADVPSALFWCLGVHGDATLPRERFVTLWQSLAATPAVTALGAVALGILSFLPDRTKRPAFWITCAGLVGWIVAVGVPGIYADYSIPFLPLVILGGGCLLAEVRVPRVGILLTIVLALGVGLPLLRENWLLQGEYVAAVDQTAAYVRSNSTPDDAILTSMPEIPLAADRRVFPFLEMGKFGMTMELDSRAAHALHLLTWAELLQVTADQRAPMVVLSRRQNANFSWSIPSQRRLQPADYHVFTTLLLSKYHCTYADDFFLVFERAEAKPKAYEIEPSAL